MKELDKFINYSLNREIEESNLYLNLCNIKLKYYINCLNKLENQKPLFFMKKRLKKYEKERNELLKSIEECKKSVAKEYNLITKLAESMNNN